MTREYVVSVRGELPSDLVERVSRIHAAAIVATDNEPLTVSSFRGQSDDQGPELLLAETTRAEG